MIDILLDENNDIDLTNGTMQLTPTLEQSTRQQILITLNTFRSEWRFNTNFGIPYIKMNENKVHLMGVGGDRLVNNYIKVGILSCEGVIKISNYDFEFNKSLGTFTIDFTVVTETGSSLTFENQQIF